MFLLPGGMSGSWGMRDPFPKLRPLQTRTVSVLSPHCATLYAGTWHSGDAYGTCEHFPIISLIGALSPLSVNCGGWTRSSLWPMVLGTVQITLWDDQTHLHNQVVTTEWRKEAQGTVWWTPTLCYQPICTCLLFISSEQFVILRFWVPAFTWIEFNLHIAMLWLSVVA